MKFSELANTRYFKETSTYEEYSVRGFDPNPDLPDHIITLGGYKVRSITHSKGHDKVVIWRDDARMVEVPLDGEFSLNVSRIQEVTSL